MKTEKEYEPFGSEWEKEVNKLDKKTLINMWRKSLSEARHFRKLHELLKFESERDIQNYNEQVDGMKEALRLFCSNEHIEQDAYEAHIERCKKKYALY